MAHPPTSVDERGQTPSCDRSPSRVGGHRWREVRTWRETETKTFDEPVRGPVYGAHTGETRPEKRRVRVEHTSWKCEHCGRTIQTHDEVD